MNINNVAFIDKFKKLNYPKNKMLIIGSGTMALLGLRKNKDLDIWVTPDIFRKLKYNKNFTKKYSKLDQSIIFESLDGNIEIVSTLPPLSDDVFDHLNRAIVVNGLYFQSPRDVLKWKKLRNDPKDRMDIVRLENYLKKNIVEYYLNLIQF